MRLKRENTNNNTQNIENLQTEQQESRQISYLNWGKRTLEKCEFVDLNKYSSHKITKTIREQIKLNLKHLNENLVNDKISDKEKYRKSIFINM